MPGASKLAAAAVRSWFDTEEAESTEKTLYV